MDVPSFDCCDVEVSVTIWLAPGASWKAGGDCVKNVPFWSSVMLVVVPPIFVSV